MINFPVLEKISDALKNNNFEYMVIGGQAVLIYGLARFTDDIDIVIQADIGKLEIVNTLISKAGFTKLKDDEFTKKTYVIPLFDDNSKMRIDLIFSFSDFERNAISRAESRILNGTEVKYASLEDVIIMKLFAGRAIDLEDIKKLLLINKNLLDKPYIYKWLKKFDEDPELNLTEKFDELLK